MNSKITLLRFYYGQGVAVAMIVARKDKPHWESWKTPSLLFLLCPLLSHEAVPPKAWNAGARPRKVNTQTQSVSQCASLRANAAELVTTEKRERGRQRRERSREIIPGFLAHWPLTPKLLQHQKVIKINQHTNKDRFTCTYKEEEWPCKSVLLSFRKL